MDKKYENPSQTFADLVCDGNGFQAVCEFCQRTHFADKNPESSDVTQELLALRVQLSQEPEKYYRHELEDGVAFGWLGGHRYVYGCPCNGITPYEDFIWENRKLILAFYEKKSSAMMGAAMEIKSGIRKAGGAQ